MTPEDEIEMLKAENAVLAGYYKEAYDALDEIKSIVIGMGLPYPRDIKHHTSQIADQNKDLLHKMKQVAHVVSEYQDQVPF